MSEARSAAQLAASIPVRVGETLPTARALEDTAITAHAPPLVSRLRAIDRKHDGGMSAARILRCRDDVPYEIATVFAETPFGALRYDDRV
ncbi:MAG: hypothetical protein LH467_08545 [Gemmatimonadaceae bacterium]|nr:hypothetical protein [Gemmatimonadaceae bacterium]